MFWHYVYPVAFGGRGIGHMVFIYLVIEDISCIPIPELSLKKCVCQSLLLGFRNSCLLLFSSLGFFLILIFNLSNDFFLFLLRLARVCPCCLQLDNWMAEAEEIRDPGS